MSILIFSPNGKFIDGTSRGLAALSTAADTLGKKIVVSSPITLTTAVTITDRQFDVVGQGKILFSGAGSLTLGSGSVEHVRPEWWGAIPEPTNTATRPATDHSIAFNYAINSGFPVKLSTGVYWVNAVHNNNKPLIISGNGATLTMLRSYSVNGYAFSDSTSLGNWAVGLVMSDLRLEGDYAGPLVGGRNGFVFGDPSAFAEGIQDTGRLEFNRVAFWNCDKGFYKPYGNIGNTYNKCSWAFNNFGYYAAEAPPHIQHVGNDTFNEGEFDSNLLAAVYLYCPSYVAGQTTFNETIFEYNPGFGIFCGGYNLSYTPLQMNHVHFEVNGTAATVTINGATLVPSDLYLKDTPMAVMDGCGVLSKMTLINSTLLEKNCTYNNCVDTIDANSVLISDKGNISYQSGETQRLVESYGTTAGPAGGAAHTLLIPTRKQITRAYNRIAGNSYSSANTYAFGGTGTVYTSVVADGVLFDSCAEITIPDTFIVSDNTGLGSVSFTEGKWYVWTGDIKLVTATKPTTIDIASTSALVGDFGGILVQNKWVTVGGITKTVSSSSAVAPRIVNSTGAPLTLRLSAFQVIEFDTKFDAIKYFNAGLYQPPTDRPRSTYSNSAPTTGTWVVGDRVANRTPTVGQPKAWVCTVSGTPGTWVSEGNL